MKVSSLLVVRFISPPLSRAINVKDTRQCKYMTQWQDWL